MAHPGEQVLERIAQQISWGIALEMTIGTASKLPALGHSWSLAAPPRRPVNNETSRIEPGKVCQRGPRRGQCPFMGPSRFSSGGSELRTRVD